MAVGMLSVRGCPYLAEVEALRKQDHEKRLHAEKVRRLLLTLLLLSLLSLLFPIPTLAAKGCWIQSGMPFHRVERGI